MFSSTNEFGTVKICSGIRLATGCIAGGGLQYFYVFPEKRAACGVDEGAFLLPLTGLGICPEALGDMTRRAVTTIDWDKANLGTIEPIYTNY